MDWSLAVAQEQCVGSGMCVGVAPDLFTLVDGRSHPITGLVPAGAGQAALSAAECCPMEAITVADAATGEPVAGPDDG